MESKGAILIAICMVLVTKWSIFVHLICLDDFPYDNDRYSISLRATLFPIFYAKERDVDNAHKAFAENQLFFLFLALLVQQEIQIKVVKKQLSLLQCIRNSS
jgi:hypothetical protein